jgi:hypothetical protein
MGHAVVSADDVEDAYAGSDVPGELRPMPEPLLADQLAITLIGVLPRSDLERARATSMPRSRRAISSRGER